MIVTGVLLDHFYNPSPVGTHDSLLYIMTRVRLARGCGDCTTGPRR